MKLIRKDSINTRKVKDADNAFDFLAVGWACSGKRLLFMIFFLPASSDKTFSLNFVD